jgi:hypothetical protein
LGIELPENFYTKLKFRKPDKDMVFVGVKAPKGIHRDSSRTHIIERFFRWLRDEWKVERIMKVVVRDDQANPCGDQIILAALDGFDVQYLDWDRIDISYKTLARACPRVRELSLYSSGNSAALHGWGDEKGLKGLEMV